MPNFKLLSLSCALALSLSACYSDMTQEFKENGRYWQRVSTTDSIYQQGPKAQQMLFQDMANCTAVINEMDRLGAIKSAVPSETWDQNSNKIIPGSPESRMGSWDTPERDGYMRTEHYNFHDFEGCMNYKGWERVSFVNPKVEERSRETYLDTIGYEKYRTKVYENTPKQPQYND